MPVESAADLAGFFDADEHGSVARIDGQAPDVEGIFSNLYIAVLDEGAEAGLGSRAPQFSFAAADAPRIAEGATVRIGDKQADGTIAYRTESYKVAGPPELDGTGLAVIQLHKQ